MAEIKSTIDIVMERTRHMVQTPEERARERAEEREKRSRGFLLKLSGNQIEPGSLTKALSDLPDEDQAPMKTVLLRTLIEGLGFESNNPPILAGVNVLAGEALRAETAEAEVLFEAYKSQSEELEKDATGSVIEELAAIGVSGSALQPKGGAASGGSLAARDLRAESESRWLALKRAMLAKV